MKLPFEYSSIESDMVGKRFAVYRNRIGSQRFRKLVEFDMKEGGEAEGVSEWNVEEGSLKVVHSPKDGFYEFGGLEVVNGKVCMSGYHSVEKGSMYKVMMSEVSPIGEDFGLCISSHKDYEEALPGIYKSLDKAGFKGPVNVVVGGCKNVDAGKVHETGNVKVITSEVNHMGFTALSEVSDVKPYWMLLHDTCSVDSDFVAKASSIDIGLNPDMVLFGDADEKLEIGLYSAEYVKGLDLGLRSVGMLKKLVENASVVVESISVPNYKGEDDVYGSGIMRKVLEMDRVGVRKYVGRRMVGGRP